jgi:hypothetical protein
LRQSELASFSTAFVAAADADAVSENNRRQNKLAATMARPARLKRLRAGNNCAAGLVELLSFMSKNLLRRWQTGFTRRWMCRPVTF